MTLRWLIWGLLARASAIRKFDLGVGRMGHQYWKEALLLQGLAPYWASTCRALWRFTGVETRQALGSLGCSQPRWVFSDLGADKPEASGSGPLQSWEDTAQYPLGRGGMACGNRGLGIEGTSGSCGLFRVK